MAVELPKDAEGREIPLDTEILYDENGNEYEVHHYKYPVRRTIPRRKCHSTEHLHIGITDDDSTAGRPVKAGCTGCHTFAQTDYVSTGPSADGCRPDDVQSTREAIGRWNGHCDDWEGIFNHD